MKKILQNIGRHYLAPALLSVALAFGSAGCDKGKEKQDLPIYENTKTSLIEQQKVETQSAREERVRELEAISTQFDSELKSARDLFNQGISDKYLSEDEQRCIFEKYKISANLSRELGERAKKYGLSEYSKEFSIADTQLYNLLSRNVNGEEIGTPKLEYALKSQGLDVRVKKIDNWGADALRGFELLWVGTALTCLSAIGIQKFKKWRNGG